MTANEKLVLERFLKLPMKSRVTLLKKMMKSLDEEDSEINKSWIQEAQRRIAAVASGEEELLPGPEVLEQIRRRYQS